MLKLVLLTLLFAVVLPIGIVCAICNALIRYGKREAAAVEETIRNAQPRRKFSARVISTEIINCWSVLQCSAEDGSEGFYLKTSDRSAKAGDTVEMVQLNDFPDMETVLRHCQVRPDEEYRNRLTEADYARLLKKLGDERDGFLYTAKAGQFAKEQILFVLVPACIVIAGIIIWIGSHKV